MALLDFLFGSGGGSSSGGSDALLKFMREQQDRMWELEGRAKETAETLTTFRRNELLDRSGYGGSVLVGGAADTGESAYAARMATLALDDPERVAYDEQFAADQAQQEVDWRILSGVQYEAEDAFAQLQTKYERYNPNDLGASAVNDIGDLEALLAEVEGLQGQYDFYESDLADKIRKDIERRRKLKNSTATGGTEYGGDASADGGGDGGASAPAGS